MTASLLIRQTHRWVSIAFLAIVAGIFAALGLGQQPAQWVYLLPLLPLAVLAGTGLYLFVLPYLPGRRRSGA
jgi:ABC-type polysaccharide/polyol phosphate export permease